MDLRTAACYIATLLILLQIAGWYMGKNGIITSMVVGILAAIAAYLFGYNRGGKVTTPEIPEFPAKSTIKTE